MAASTRSSSKQNSPASGRVASNDQGTPSRTPSATPTRKAPQCRLCKQPMKGHPKGSCPPVERQEEISSDDDGEEQPPIKAMRIINLGSPAQIIHGKDKDKAFIRERRRKSLQATTIPRGENVQELTASTTEIVDRLLEQDDNDEDATKVIQWQDALKTTPEKSPFRQYMPCTLIPPTPDNSFVMTSGHNGVAKVESPPLSMACPGPSSSEQAESSAQPHRPQPLARSMSGDERDLFLSILRKEAKASIYVVPKEDVLDLEASAQKLKFSTFSWMNENKADPHALFIISNDELALRKTVKRIEEECEASGIADKGKASTSRSKIAALAGGAVAGALGTWAGLAYA